MLLQRLTQQVKTGVTLLFRLCIMLGQTREKLLLVLTWLLQWKNLRGLLGVYTVLIALRGKRLARYVWAR